MASDFKSGVSTYFTTPACDHIEAHYGIEPFAPRLRAIPTSVVATTFMRLNIVTHGGRDFETLISLRVTYSTPPTKGRAGLAPASRCVLSITLPRVAGLITPDHDWC